MASSSSHMASRKSDLRFLQLKPGWSGPDLVGLLEEHGVEGVRDDRRRSITTLLLSSERISLSGDSDFSASTERECWGATGSLEANGVALVGGGSEQPESLDVNEPELGLLLPWSKRMGSSNP